MTIAGLSRAVCLGAAALLLLPVAQAKRRDRRGPDQTLRLQLEQAVKFGKHIVPPGRYRLRPSGRQIVFVDENSMVLVARVTARKTRLGKAVRPGEVAFEKNKKVARLSVRSGRHAWSVRGHMTTLKRAGRQMTLRNKGEQKVDDAEAIQRVTDEQLVRDGLARYLPMVAHCGQRARRSRWKTDDPRFFNCVCSWMEKWRMPRVQQEVRFHQKLLKREAGFSFSVTPEGRAVKCRVWRGAQSPEVAGSTPEAPSGEEAGPSTQHLPQDGQKKVKHLLGEVPG